MATQNANLAALSEAGVSVWLDDLSRQRLDSGNLQELIDTKSVVGVTTNPSIFQKALAEGDAYDGQIAELAERGADVDATIRTVTTDDVRRACDVLAPQWEASDGIDGRVSIEVDPRLADETDKTDRAGHRTVEDRRPAQPVHQDPSHQGRPAGHHRRSGGRDFGQRHADLLGRASPPGNGRLPGRPGEGPRGRTRPVQDPFGGIVFRVPGGHRDRQAAGKDRNSEDALGLRGKAGVANARLAYAAYEEVFEGGERFRALKADGARVQRPLWASTGVKNPDYSDTLYVTELVAPNTVNTMPEKTIDAVADHGEITGDTVSGTAASRPGGVRRAEAGGDRPDRRLQGAGGRRRGEVRGRPGPSYWKKHRNS